MYRLNSPSRCRLRVAHGCTASLAALALALAGCGDRGGANERSQNKKTPQENVPRIQTVTVEARDLVQQIELPATVEGYETADLYAKVGGFLEKIVVDIGDRVEADQVLAVLSVPEMHNEVQEKQAGLAAARANVKQAEAAIRQSKAQLQSMQAKLDEAHTHLEEKQARLQQQLAEYNRTQALVERGSLNDKLLDEATYQRDAAKSSLASVQAQIRTAQAVLDAGHADVDRAKTDLASANAKVDLVQAELERVQTMLEYSKIRAPFAGVVTKRFFDHGAFIQPADGNSAARPLLTITRTDMVRILLDLPMAEIRWLNLGDKAVLDRINVLPSERFEGEVTRFAPSLNRSSRMMRVEVDLDNPNDRLLPGYYGYVTLLLDEFRQTPVIPSSALMAEGNDTFVFVVEGNVCRKRPVITGYQNGEIVGIRSGLSSGQQIVEAGTGQLRDGQEIVPVAAKSNT